MNNATAPSRTQRASILGTEVALNIQNVLFNFVIALFVASEA